MLDKNPVSQIKTYKDYLGDLIGGSLMIKESQIVAELLLKKPNQEEWVEAIVNQNVLQKRSDASAKRNGATIKKRIEKMPDEYLEKVAFGNTELSTQLMLAATLMNCTLLADFMRNIVLDAKRMYRESLDISDWESFWDDRSRLFPELAQMSESSTYKIAQVAFKVLADADYLETTRNKKLQNVYVLPEVKSLLISMERDDIIEAMELN